MTQVEINQALLDILSAMATELGVDKYDEPKHDIIGHAIGTKINELQTILWDHIEQAKG